MIQEREPHLLCLTCRRAEGTLEVQVWSKPLGQIVEQGRLAGPLRAFAEAHDVAPLGTYRRQEKHQHTGQFWDVYQLDMQQRHAFVTLAADHNCVVYCLADGWAL